MTTRQKDQHESIRDVMSSPPVTTTTSTTLEQVARQMRDEAIGDVIVLEGDLVWGILTDRDIVIRAVAEGRDPARTRVADVASRDLTTVSPDDGVDDAIDLMRGRAVRRLPVVDNGRPVGVVSLGDLALERDPDSCLGQISAAPPNV
jgi:CBS domain-containing protein